MNKLSKFLLGCLLLATSALGQGLDVDYMRTGLPNPNWRDPVANVGALPLVNNNIGDVRITIDTYSFYMWDGANWQPASGGGAIISNLTPGTTLIIPAGGAGNPTEVLYIKSDGSVWSDSNMTRSEITQDSHIQKTGVVYDSFVDVGDAIGVGVDHVIMNIVNQAGGGNDTALAGVIDGSILGETGTTVFLQSDDGIKQAVQTMNLNSGIILNWNDGGSFESSYINLKPTTGSQLGYRDAANTIRTSFTADPNGLGWQDEIGAVAYYLPIVPPTANQVVGSIAGLPTGGQLDWVDVLSTVAVDGITITGDGTIANPLVVPAVSSLNTLTGAVTLAAGTNITLTPVGNTITIDASALSLTGTPTEIVYFDGVGNPTSDSLATRTATNTIVGKTIGNVTRKLQIGTFNGTENAANLGVDTTGGAQRLAISGVADLSGFGFGNLSTTQFYQDVTRDSVVIADVTGVTAFYDEPATPGKTGALLLRPANAQWFYSSGNTAADGSSNITIDNNLMSFIFTPDVTTPLVFSEFDLAADDFRFLTEAGIFLRLNVLNGLYDVGDYQGTANGMALSINDPSQTITLGASAGSGNNSFIGVFDGAAQTFRFSTELTGVDTDLLFVSNGTLDRLLFGVAALVNWTTGLRDTSIGNGSGTQCTDCNDSTYLGYAAGGGSTKTGLHRNTGVGEEALYNLGSNNQTDNTAIGYHATAGNNISGTIAIGSGAITTLSNQAVIGGSSDTTKITEMVLYRGTSSADADEDQFILKKTDAIGTNKSTSQWRVSTGNSTGNADGGQFIISVAKGGASGTGTNDALANDIALFSPTEIYQNTRVWTAMGSVTAANDMDSDETTRSNTMTVSGSTTINGLGAGLCSAQPIVLLYAGSPLVKHQASPGVAYRPFKLAGSVDFQAVPDCTQTFICDGTDYIETARTCP